jgi:hypothetical protein
MKNTFHYGEVGVLKSYQYQYKQNYVLQHVSAVRRDFIYMCQWKPLGKHYVGGWVKPRACQDATDKRKISLLPGAEPQPFMT